MYQLRQSSVGNIQTNVRIGKSDFIVRQKLKSDKRKWKDITPIDIPVHVSKADVTLLKKSREEEEDKNLYNKMDDEEPEEEIETEERYRMMRMKMRKTKWK